MLISIIVPIYNVKNFLRECLDSILVQTYHDFECVLIDDGSTDGCAQICDEYAKIDKRFRVIHKGNGGLVSAWKTGVEYAKGEYIAFIDSDDFVANDYLEILVSSLEPETDIVAMHCMNHYDNGRTEPVKLFSLPPGKYSIDNSILSRFADGSYKLLSINRWAKIIRSTIVQDYSVYCSPLVSFAEDYQLYVGVVSGSKNIVLLDEYKYFYRINNDSIMHTYKKKCWEQVNTIFESIDRIPTLKRIENIAYQLNTEFLYFACYCMENEYEAGLFDREYFQMIANSERTQAALLSYRKDGKSKFHLMLIKALKNKSFGKAKRAFFLRKFIHSIRRHL